MNTKRGSRGRSRAGKGSAEGGVPQHVAVIMDGNGRWARQRKLPRLRGHEAGAESVAAVLRVCRDLDIRYLTLYAFSIENWTRPASEIAGLMRLLLRFLKEREKEMHEHRIRLRLSGRVADLPADVRRELERVVEVTSGYGPHEVILALSYGARAELVDAMRGIAGEVKAGVLAPDEIDEATVARHLYVPDVPDPDLMIRTSGEVRLSNFLLWQLSYTELYFCDVLWPDFREEHFMQAIDAYRQRQRRYGDIG